MWFIKIIFDNLCSLIYDILKVFNNINKKIKINYTGYFNMKFRLEEIRSILFKKFNARGSVLPYTE